MTNWRLKYRRQMNETDQEASTRAIDSLLNYETVKYFGNEQYEAARFDQALARYERASVASKSSLSLLNIGQATIIGTGLAILMTMAGRGVIAKTLTVGDFVLINTYLIQLYIPLNFLGFVYREIKQALTDMESMFNLLDVSADVKDAPNARPLRDGPGNVAFEHVSFAYDPRRTILDDVSFTVPAGHRSRDRRRERRGQVDDLAAPVPLLRRRPRPRDASTARTYATRLRPVCALRSASFRKTPCSSTIRSTTTSPTAVPARHLPRSRKPRGSHGSTTSSWRRRTATRPWSASAGSSSRAARSSASRSRARS